METIIEVMAQAIQQHHLEECILDSEKKKQGDKPLEEKGNGHALIAVTSSPNTWIIHSGDIHHMA